MFKIFGNRLSSSQIEGLERQAIEAGKAGREDEALRLLEPLRRARGKQREVAESLLRIVSSRCLSIEAGLDLFWEIAEAHSRDTDILIGLGDSAEAVRDLDDLNAAPSEHPLFRTLVDRLSAIAEDGVPPDKEETLLRAIATSARMMARQGDETAERYYRRLVEIDPKKSAYHYNLGLFYKTRGRFEEGMASNRTAASLVEEEVESYEWNLGICATGCGNGPVALDVWKRMGQKIEMGRFGLPEGGYPECKVKLAQRPLAERGADDDDPGLEETIWIERLSPCHGVVRSVLYQDLGVDYGDVVLIDGAPITYHTYGDQKVPVHPHLATLLRRNYRFYDFAGMQDEARRLADASAALDRDAIIYSHTESFRTLCANCWRDPELDHEDHETMEKHVVTGRIAAPPEIGPAELLDQIDRAMAERNPCGLYTPALCEAAGLADRAAVEKRRFDMLRGN